MTEPRPNVIFVVLDSVRRDRVSTYGYGRETTPRFDQFAAGATLFEDAVAQAAWSIPGHASLLTGLYPDTHGATTVSPVLRSERTLPLQLSRAGYDTYAVSPNRFVRPLTGFGAGFDEFRRGSGITVPDSLVSLAGPLLNQLAGSPLVRRPVERGFNRIGRRGDQTGIVSPAEYDVAGTVDSVLADASEPFFLFVNLPHAHLPRSPDPAYRDRFVDGELPASAVTTNERAHTFREQSMDAEAMEAMSQMYDADLRTLDDRLDSLLGTLDGYGLREDTLIALVADHGEHLGECGLVGHQHSLFEPVVSVPLAIDFPDRGPGRVESQVETRRLYHTVLETTGVREFPDRSLSSGTGDAVARGSFHSPMLDLRAFLRDRRVVYDPSLLGEPLTFRRTQEEKVIRFCDDSWRVAVTQGGRDQFPRREQELFPARGASSRPDPP